MATVLITGGNRGIGLELVRRYLKEGWTVHACCRKPEAAKALQNLARSETRLQIHALDLLDAASIRRLPEALNGAPIDLLINNAGVSGPADQQLFGRMDYEAWLEMLQVNTFGPMKVMEALLDNLLAGSQKHVVSMTSGLASIANQEGYMLAYSSSKTALNAVMKSLSVALKDKGLRVNLLSPGWVRTEMGGTEAPISAEQSASQLYDNIAALGKDDSGLYIGLEGNLLPW